MFLNKVSDEWVPLQEKVFTRWVVSQLQGVEGVNIQNVTKDLSNGVALVELATKLTGKAPSAWSHSPKFNAQMVTNCDTALDMFTKDGVRLVGISGKDIHDNNDKLILGLIWTLILKYSIGQSVRLDTKDNASSSTTQSTKNDKDALMDWAIERTSGYPNIHNFAPYDLSVCALLDSYVPEKINYYSLDPKDTEHNSELASNVMKELGIPVLVYPEDIAKDSEVDKKALLTQLSSAKVVLDSPTFEQEHRSEKSTVVESKESTTTPVSTSSYVPSTSTSTYTSSYVPSTSTSTYTSSYVPSTSTSTYTSSYVPSTSTSTYTSSYVPSTTTTSSVVPTNNSTTTTTTTSTSETTDNGVTTKTTKTTTVTTSNATNTTSTMSDDIMNDPFFSSARHDPVFDSIDNDHSFSTTTHETTFKSIEEDPFFESARHEPVFDSIDNDSTFHTKDIEFHRIESDPFFQSNKIETTTFQPFENSSLLSSTKNETHFETSTRNEPVFEETHFETSTRNEPVFEETHFETSTIDPLPTASHSTNTSNCTNSSSYTSTTYHEKSVSGTNTTPVVEHEEHHEHFENCFSTPAAEPISAPIEPTPVEEPIPTPVEEPIPTPVEEPIPTPVEEPIPTPVEEPVPTPVEEPVPTPVEEPVPTPVEEPVPAPVEETVVETKEVEISEPIVTVGQEVEGDNSEYAGRRFGLVLTLDEAEYNNGQRMVDGETHPMSGHEVHLALTLSHDYTPFQNSAGLKLDVAMPFDPEHDANQQFIFRSDFNVIIDSAVRGGMVWDVCDGDNLNPPDGTVFYVFPFHGRHNQQFIFRNGHIYAKQNGQVVTYVGGDAPLVMMQQSPALRSRQTFEIRLL